MSLSCSGCGGGCGLGGCGCGAGGFGGCSAGNLGSNRARAGAGASRVGEGRANVSPTDVGKDDVSRRVLGQDTGRVACSAAAWAAASTVEPIHEPTVIVPDAEDQDHSPTERLAHGGQAAEGGR